MVEEFLARQGSSRDEEDGESGHLRPGRDRGIVRGFARVRALVFARRGVHLVEHGLDNLRELVHEFEARPNEEHHLVARRLEGASLEVVEAIDAVLSQGGHLGDAHEGRPVEGRERALCGRGERLAHRTRRRAPRRARAPGQGQTTRGRRKTWGARGAGVCCCFSRQPRGKGALDARADDDHPPHARKSHASPPERERKRRGRVECTTPAQPSSRASACGTRENSEKQMGNVRARFHPDDDGAATN